MRFAKLLRLAPLLLGLAGIAPALAHDVSAEMATLEERIEELRIREVLLQSQIRAEGGSATAHIGIAAAEWRVNHNERQIAELQEVAALYRKSADEMQELARQRRNIDVITISDVAQEGGEQAAEKVIKDGLERAGKRSAKRVLGIASIVGDVVEYSGKWVIRSVDSHRLRQEALAERIHLVDVVDTILQFQLEANAERARIRVLRDLQEQIHANNDALATSRARLEALRTHRHDTPPAPVAAPVKPKPRGGVRLCDPSQQHRPVGIRTVPRASRTASAAGKEKQPADKAADEPLAEGDVCVDIIGRWTMQQTIQVHGRSAPMGPPLRVEIVHAAGAADSNAPPRYELYGPDKASALNGPLMRCTRTGHQLACQRRVQQQACPAAKYAWSPLQLTIATDVNAISGELRQTYLMDPRNDPTGCTVVAGEGLATINFRLTRLKP